MGWGRSAVESNTECTRYPKTYYPDADLIIVVAVIVKRLGPSWYSTVEVEIELLCWASTSTSRL
jgi:hypothetical protein